MNRTLARHTGTSTRMAKRALDLVGAATGLALAAVPMAVIAVFVRASMGPPVLFSQERPGLHGC
jgi:sugar transferase EpsL